MLCFSIIIFEESLTRHESRIASKYAADLQSVGILSGSGISVYVKSHGIYQIEK
jgi:hypothetical protein